MPPGILYELLIPVLMDSGVITEWLNVLLRSYCREGYLTTVTVHSAVFPFVLLTIILVEPTDFAVIFA